MPSCVFRSSIAGSYLFYLQDNTHVGPDVDVDWDEETKDVDVCHVGHAGREDTDEALLPHAGGVDFRDMGPVDVATVQSQI